MYLGDESKLMLRAALVAFNMSVQDCYSIAQTNQNKESNEANGKHERKI